MDFFNGLGQTLEEVGKQVEEKSREIWEAGRLNVEIFKQEDAIRRIYRKIGEQVSSDYDRGQKYGDAVNKLCSEIQDRQRSIEELKSRLSEIKKTGRQSDQNSGHQNMNAKASEQENEASREDEDSPKEPDISYYEAVEKMQKMQRSN